MKEFNLEAAKAGKPVCTRGGRPVRIICWDRQDPGEIHFPIVALVKNGKILENLEAYTIEGKWWGANSPNDDDFDLMMLPEKKQGWINLYKNDRGVYTAQTIAETKDAAYNGRSDKDYLTTVKIEWEE